MVAGEEPEFPPLFPLGWHRTTLSELRRVSVEAFPLSATREEIMAGLEAIVDRLAAVKIVGDLWLDGSFLTEKINPKDSDVALCVDAPSMYDFGSDEQHETIDWLRRNLKNTDLLCDSYVIFTYPIPHVMFEEGEWWKIWYQKQFGFSREDDPKGIVVISIPDGAQ